jgi:peptide/nickel transport system permease protein
VTGSAILFFVCRRLAVMALLLVLIAFFIFSLLYLAPGDPVNILLGQGPVNDETRKLLTHEYHLDQPFLTQFWLWARGAVQLDLGRSIVSTLPVTYEIKTRLPTSLFLGAYAFIVESVLGVGFGAVAALRAGSARDRSIVGVSIVGLSMPAFVCGVILLFAFTIELPWFPSFGAGSGFFDRIWHLTLPAFALALTGFAFLVKHTRASLLNVIHQDYVVFARARGLSARRVLLFYILRNGLIPIITISALILSGLITGAILAEVTFSLPGIGALLAQSADQQDLPMIQGIGMLVAAIIIVSNLLADLCYIAVDPRIRHQVVRT